MAKLCAIKIAEDKAIRIRSKFHRTKEYSMAIHLSTSFSWVISHTKIHPIIPQMSYFFAWTMSPATLTCFFGSSSQITVERPLDWVGNNTGMTIMSFGSWNRIAEFQRVMHLHKLSAGAHGLITLVTTVTHPWHRFLNMEFVQPRFAACRYLGYLEATSGTASLPRTLRATTAVTITNTLRVIQ